MGMYDNTPGGMQYNGQTMFGGGTYQQQQANQKLGPNGYTYRPGGVLDHIRQPGEIPAYLRQHAPRGGMMGSVYRQMTAQPYNPVANDAAYQASQRGMQPSQMTPQNAALLAYGMPGG